MQMLQDQRLANAVLEIFADESELRCAVAFWGPVHARIARERGAKVILDISMGGVSKSALAAFGVESDRLSDYAANNVRVLDGLHAKIYLGRDTCIVGSANASGNALGTAISPAALREAAIQFDRRGEKDAFRTVENLWLDYLNASRPVTTDDLDRAPRVVGNAAARDRTAGAGNGTTSILEAVLERPDDFARTAFVFGDHDIKPTELVSADKAYKRESGRAPADDRRVFVCTLKKRGDDAENVLRHASSVVSFWFGRGKGIYAYHDLNRVEHGKVVSYYGRRSWKNVSKALGLGSLTQDLAWSTDYTVAERFADSNDEDLHQRYVVLSAEELHEAMDRRAATS